ncbi:MAG: (Fe-S)-binding protein [Paeniclostridium sp.]
MALKALDIFKLTPKKNCKDCGFPTCMAFCMKVASGAVEVSACPKMAPEALAKLGCRYCTSNENFKSWCW